MLWPTTWTGSTRDAGAGAYPSGRRELPLEKPVKHTLRVLVDEQHPRAVTVDNGHLVAQNYTPKMRPRYSVHANINEAFAAMIGVRGSPAARRQGRLAGVLHPDKARRLAAKLTRSAGKTVAS